MSDKKQAASEDLSPIEQELLSFFDVEEYTPYQLTIECNRVFAEYRIRDRKNRIKKLPAQMLYRYARQGLLDGRVRMDDEPTGTIDRVAALQWLIQYLEKNGR